MVRECGDKMLMRFIDFVVYSLLGLSSESNRVEMLHFFLYDTIKIFYLLFVMITIVGVIRTYFPPQKIKEVLVKSGHVGKLIAAMLGALTPFCSCSSIPLFLSFVELKIPVSVMFSFLVTSPLINEYLVVLMFGFFGWKITLAYVVSGLILGIAAGSVLELWIRPEDFIVRSVDDGKKKSDCLCLQNFPTFWKRLQFGMREAVSIIKSLWLWIIIAVGIGALIHNYVPEDAIQQIISKTGIWTVPIAVLVGIPMYGSCAAIVPIAMVLFEKGLPIGTALAFMMAIAALSLPEAIILKRVMQLRHILLFFGIVGLGIIFTGYVFNFLQPFLV